MLPLLISCGNSNKTTVDGSDNAPEINSGQVFAKENSKLKIQDSKIADSSTVVGANRLDEYLPLLQNKKVGIVTNQSGLIFKSYPHNKENAAHIVDSLLARDIEVVKIFSPEHGFRGDGDAGEKIKDGKDPKTGLPIISLHGKNRKPSQEQLDGLDIIVFDIQDVGVRFYTYISTLTHVMQAAAEKGVPVIVLDRPNPNAHYIDGPTLQKEHSSFLGMHEIPLVYGMTIGEYAKMVNGEGWLEDNIQCELTIIPLENWNYQSKYSLPTRPSPNLPNDKSINLYPSLGFFEGTTINAGRGTEMQFQVFGSPHLPKEYYTFSYTPQPNFGSKDPKEKGQLCNGLDLRNETYLERVNLEWLVEAYNASDDQENFFKTASFTLHAGNTELEKRIKQGFTFREIRKGWLKDIEDFKKTRAKYLMYE